ncbi:hypothetical protein [Candidatus Parabeggiatoa sp. HSG14]|nr:hypothetical protein [Thiotrichales bacterium HSG14]
MTDIQLASVGWVKVGWVEAKRKPTIFLNWLIYGGLNKSIGF